MAAWLHSQSIAIDKVLVSPYVRAQQTLQVVAEQLSLPQSECLSELTPGGDAGQVRDYLYALAQQGVQGVLLISHLPLVGYLVAELCPAQTPPMFATSAVASIQVNDQSGMGEYCWQIGPTQLAAKQLAAKQLAAKQQAAK